MAVLGVACSPLCPMAGRCILGGERRRGAEALGEEEKRYRLLLYPGRRPSLRLLSMAACSSPGELRPFFSHSYGYRYFIYLWQDQQLSAYNVTEGKWSTFQRCDLTVCARWRRRWWWRWAGLGLWWSPSRSSCLSPPPDLPSRSPAYKACTDPTPAWPWWGFDSQEYLEETEQTGTAEFSYFVWWIAWNQLRKQSCSFKSAYASVPPTPSRKTGIEVIEFLNLWAMSWCG